MIATGHYRKLIDAIAELSGLPDWLGVPAGVWLEAQCLQESGGDPHARHYDAGMDPDKHDSGDFEEWASYGLFQIEGITFRRTLHLQAGTPLNFAEHLYRPAFNAALGIRFMAENYSSTGDVAKALAMYNGGGRGAQESSEHPGQLVNQVYVDLVTKRIPTVLADRPKGTP